MGYILPVDNNQYKQYEKNQITKKEKTPYMLEDVQRPTIQTKLKKDKYEVFDDHGEQKEHVTNNKNQNKQNVVEVEQETIDYYVAELTGKGQHFNDYA